MTERTYTLSEAALVLDVSEDRLYAAALANKVPCVVSNMKEPVVTFTEEQLGSIVVATRRQRAPRDPEAEWTAQ
jgi:hypothetical protein